MAIYGTIDTCAAQVGDRPHFATAFAFLKEVFDGSHEAAQAVKHLPQGTIKRVNLAGPDGRDAYALLQHPTTRPREDQLAESHREYADIQAVFDGDEILEVMPLEGLEVTQPYDASKDVALYQMPAKGSQLILRPGLAAILFPEDGHAPLQDPHGVPTPSRRIVVKVRVGSS
jgi:YhcH/YjgK/YiaL family protein